jgi:hypothetical protein
MHEILGSKPASQKRRQDVPHPTLGMTKNGLGDQDEKLASSFNIVYLIMIML